MDAVYIRRLFPHDITHEVSVTASIVAGFFEGKTRGLRFFKEDGGLAYSVDINSATDPRFGGDFKSMYARELVEDDDILLVLKKSEGFRLYVIKQGDVYYRGYRSLFDSRRHVVLSLNSDETPCAREELLAALGSVTSSITRSGQY